MKFMMIKIEFWWAYTLNHDKACKKFKITYSLVEGAYTDKEGKQNESIHKMEKNPNNSNSKQIKYSSF